MGGRARCIGGCIMIAIETAQDFLKDNFAQWILDMGIEVIEMSDDGATLEIPITPHIERVGGIVCGQALSSLADTSMVFACFSAMGGFKPVATTNLETRFLSGAKGERITCAARVIKQGRSLIFCEATLTAMPSARAVASASATFFVPN